MPHRKHVIVFRAMIKPVARLVICVHDGLIRSCFASTNASLA